MERIIQVLETVLPVILVVLIGMLVRKSGKITREGINQLKSVAVDIALPAVLLNAFATADYSLKSIVIPLIMFLLCILAWAAGVFSAKLLRIPSRFAPFLTTGFEAGMLGYTLYSMLFGAENTRSFALVDLGQVLFVFTVYKILLRADSGKNPSYKSLLRDMLSSPVILAILAGLLLGATGLYRALVPSGIAGIFDSCTSFVAAPTSVLILLSIGYDLVFKEIRWMETMKIALLRLVLMLALMAAATLGISALFGYDRALAGALIVMFILPPPYVLPVFADDDTQRTYISSALSVSTLISVAAFAVLAAIGL